MATPYSSIEKILTTGDIVLFSGKTAYSQLIKRATLSLWSHVGFILRIPEYDFLTFWESTSLGSIRDLEFGAIRKGVQLVSLNDRIQQYRGIVSVRKLQGALLSKTSLKTLAELRDQLRGKSYEQSKMELFKAAYAGPFGHSKPDLSSIFCSQLVAEAYQRLGLLSKEIQSNDYMPSDFSEKRMTGLLGGFYLSEEIIIKEI